ncbi:MAG: ABC transporter ATP-binding protein/permease [Bacilli bacterium]|jgi:ATP-binding cassette subfamily B protein|nr:ABC transporter ATP-binding protein/permease [Bacilli bacterium]
MFHLYNKYWKYYKWQAILAPIFKMLEAVFALLVPIVVKRIIDQGIVGGAGEGYILNQGWILLGLAVVGFLTTMVCQVFAVKVSSSYGFHVRNDIYKKINELSLKEEDEFTPSSLETRISSDVTITQKGLTLLLRLAIRAPFLVIGSIVMAFILSPEDGWIFILTGLLLGFVIWLISYLSLPKNNKIQKKLDQVTTVGNDNLEGARVVRAFNKEEYEKKRFFSSVDDLEKISKQLAKISSWLNPLNSLIINLGIILVLWAGSRDINVQGGLTAGDVVALVNYMNQIAAAEVVVANLVTVFSKSSSSAKRIDQVLTKEPSIVGGEIKPDLNVDGSIEFDDVSFAYDSASAPALKDISFKAEKGQVIGIIGGTGSGKTTLADLLDRFYDVSSGSIKIGGSDIRKWDLSYLRSSIGYVSQHSVLFSGTIKSNLLMSCPEANDKAIEDAIRISQSKDIVSSKKDGLESEVNQGGKNFSGGQKQRLSIARALVKKTQILILDDSSSALDFKTDFELRKALKEELSGMTVFLISQRVSSIRDADQILVLDQGRMVGLGKDQDLYKTSPIYKEISDSQRQQKAGESK